MKIDIKGIIEGLTNKVSTKRWIEEVSADRMYICKKCDLYSENIKEPSEYSKLRLDVHCTKCGCNLELKTRCMSCSCPIEKWVNVLSEDDWLQIKNNLNDSNPKS